MSSIVYNFDEWVRYGAIGFLWDAESAEGLHSHDGKPENLWSMLIFGLVVECS